MKLGDLSRLVRLPLVVSAVGDPVAGLVLAGGGGAEAFLGVALASALLYMGGMALNDLFDLGVDRERHPARVLPSGAISPAVALHVGSGCLIAGVLVATFVTVPCGATALLAAIAVLAYDGGMKRSALAGCLMMGLCRGLSVLIGVHAGGGFTPPTFAYWAAAVHTIYIAAVTGLSLLEDAAGVTRRQILARLVPALASLAVVPLLLAAHPLVASIPLVLLAARLLWNLEPDAGGPTRPRVMKRVGMAVRGILLVDVAYLWGAGAWTLGAVVFLLYVFSHVRRPRGSLARRSPT